MDTVSRQFTRHRSTLLLIAVALLAAAGLLAAMTSGTARAGTAELGLAAATEPPVEATGPPTPDVETTPTDEPSSPAPPTLDVCPNVADGTPAPVGEVVAPARYNLARASTTYAYTVDVAGFGAGNLIDSDGKSVVRCTAPARTKLVVTRNEQPTPDALWFDFAPVKLANCDVSIDTFDDKGVHKSTHKLNVPNSGVTIENDRVKLVGAKGSRIKITVTCN